MIRGKRPKAVDLANKVFIVTGANSGIGFETALSLVKMGATVILACRTISKGNQAKQIIQEITKSDKVSTFIINQLFLHSYFLLSTYR